MNTISDNVFYTLGHKSLIAKMVKSLLVVIIFVILLGILAFSRNAEIVTMIDTNMHVDSAWWAMVIIGAVTLVVACFQIISAWISYITTKFQVTSNALIIQRGFLMKQEDSFPLRYINNVSHRRGVIEQVLGVGTCMIELNSDETDASHADKVVLDDMDQGLLEELENMLLNRAQAQKVVVSQ